GRWAVWWPSHGGRVLCDGPIAPLPAWLHEKLATQNGQHKRCSLPMAEIVSEAGRIPKPLYFEVLRLVPLSATVTRRHQRWVISILSKVTARRKDRNDTLFTAAINFRDPITTGVVTCDAAMRLLFGAAQCCGYVAKDGDAAAMRTIQSGLGIGH